VTAAATEKETITETETEKETETETETETVKEAKTATKKRQKWSMQGQAEKGEGIESWRAHAQVGEREEKKFRKKERRRESA